MKSCPSGCLPGILVPPSSPPPQCVWGNSYSLIKTQLDYPLSQEMFLVQHRREEIMPFTAAPLHLLANCTLYTVAASRARPEHCSKGRSDITMNKMDKKRVVYKHVANYIHSILSGRIVVFRFCTFCNYYALSPRRDY